MLAELVLLLPLHSSIPPKVHGTRQNRNQAGCPWRTVFAGNTVPRRLKQGERRHAERGCHDELNGKILFFGDCHCYELSLTRFASYSTSTDNPNLESG